MSKYYTPFKIACDILFGRLHSHVEEKSEIKFITTNPPYGNNKEKL